MALTEEQLNAVKNKYLDGEGLAHLWEKIKAQSAKIALIGSTGSTWKEILLQESNKKDKKYIEWLLSAEQDVMIEDVSDNNRRYYYVKQEKGDHGRLDYIWESYSSSKIYRITVKGDSLALILTKEEFPYGDQDGYAFNTYVAGAYIDDNKNKIHFIDGTYNHSINNLEVEVNNTGGTLIFNDKVGKKTLTFDVASYVADEVSDATQNLIEIVEGKTKTYVIDATRSDAGYSNLIFTSRDASISANIADKFKTNDGDCLASDLKLGDVILVYNTGYPDRWVSQITTDKVYFAELEVDLSGFVTGTKLIADTIILGNGSSGVKTSNATITSSITNIPSTWTNIPNIGAIINYVQPKLDALGSTIEPIYVSSAGTIAKCTRYAGGTSINLNGEDSAGKAVTFYAPITLGNAGTILKVNSDKTGFTYDTECNPTSHAVVDPTYGGATDTLYGHVKLVKGDVDDYNSKNETVGKALAADAYHTHSNYVRKTVSSGTYEKTISDVKDSFTITIKNNNANQTVFKQAENYFNLWVKGQDSKPSQDWKFLSSGKIIRTPSNSQQSYLIVDTSMTLTTGEIDSIIKDLENNS